MTDYELQQLRKCVRFLDSYMGQTQDDDCRISITRDTIYALVYAREWMQTKENAATEATVA